MKLPQLYDIFREKWEKYQSIYLISDTHFDDKELAAAGLNPLRRDSEEYLKVINSKIGKRDMIIHLGDVGNLDYIRRCRAAYKVLVCGNHDAGASNYKRQVYQEIFDADQYDKKQILQIMREKYPNCQINISDDIHYSFRKPFEFYVAFADNKLFDEVYTGPIVIGEKLILSHEPVDIIGMFNLHGHIHAATYKNDSTHFNCCSDYVGYTPINFNQWMKQGYLSKIQTLHRKTIDKATLNKHGQKRLKRKK